MEKRRTLCHHDSSRVHSNIHSRCIALWLFFFFSDKLEGGGTPLQIYGKTDLCAHDIIETTRMKKKIFASQKKIFRGGFSWMRRFSIPDKCGPLRLLVTDCYSEIIITGPLRSSRPDGPQTHHFVTLSPAKAIYYIVLFHKTQKKCIIGANTKRRVAVSSYISTPASRLDEKNRGEDPHRQKSSNNMAWV